MFRQYLSDFWRTNKAKVYKIIKFIIAGIIILFILKSALENLSNTDYKLLDSSAAYTPTYTISTGNIVKQEDYEEDSNIVDKFVEFCNNGDIENAYNLITEECKNELYPKIEDFEEKYFSKYFSTKKQYNLQSWATTDSYNIYKIRILDDLLTTGNYSDSKKYEDYITVYNDKINLNGYIKEKKIGKEVEKNGIKIYVDKVNIYMNYEYYTINITNNTENDILIDSLQTAGRSLRIVSNNDYKYSAVVSKYIDMLVEANNKKTIKIKFQKKYTSNENSKYIQFSQIVMDYFEFMKNKDEYNDVIEINVELD